MRTNSVGEKLPNTMQAKDTSRWRPQQTSPPSCRRMPPHPARRPSFSSGATSWRGTPRRPRRSKPSWPRHSPPPACAVRPRRSYPGSATRCFEPFGQGLRPRPHGLPPAHAGARRHTAGGHRRPRQALQGAPSWKPAEPRPRWQGSARPARARGEFLRGWCCPATGCPMRRHWPPFSASPTGISACWNGC